MQWIKRKTLWQYRYLTLATGGLLLLAVLLLPGMMDGESELRIKPVRQGLSLPDGFYVYQRLDEQGIRIKSITLEDRDLVIRLDSPDQQQQAKDALLHLLPQGFNIAIMEIPAPAYWARKLARLQQSLG